MVNLIFRDLGSWHNPFNVDGWRCFKIGTVHGAYRLTATNYEILAIANDSPGNGHVDIALDYLFEYCTANKKNLIFKELLDENFGNKLIGKYGFTWLNKTDLIKRF